MSDYLKPAVAILIPHLGSYAGSFVTRKNSPWLKTLRQPSWMPSGKIIGPAWFLLNTAMGYASYLVWRDGGGFHGDAAVPLAWYGAQLAVNWAWGPVFFGMRSLKGGFVVTLMMMGGISGTISSFSRINSTAGYLLVPYLVWTTFASCINFKLMRDN